MPDCERVEKVAGVCPVLYKPSNPEMVLILQENEWKRQTGKLANMWGLPYETVEPNGFDLLESHKEAIGRCTGDINNSGEEIRVLRGAVLIPEDLERSKLSIVRISPPEIAAWVHAYACPVTEDFLAERGRFYKEIGGLVWANASRLLATQRGRERIKPLRAGTYEILPDLFASLRDETRPVGIYPNPFNLPPWEIYDLLEAGLSQREALSRVGIDPKILEDSHFLIHSLAESQLHLNGASAPRFSPAFPL